MSYDKEYYQRNKEYINKKHKEYYYNNKEKVKRINKKSYLKHKDKRAEYRKAYYLSHREQTAKKCKEWREKNKEHFKKCQIEWTKKNRDYLRNYHRNNWLTIDDKCVRVKKRTWTGYCELCGKEKVSRLYYHHWDDKNPDRGIWVCFSCHQICETTDKGLLHLAQRYLKFKRALNKKESSKVMDLYEHEKSV